MIGRNNIDEFINEVVKEIRQYKQFHGVCPTITQWSKEYKRCTKPIKRRNLTWYELIEYAFSGKELKQMEMKYEEKEEKSSFVDLDYILESMKAVQKINESITPRDTYAVINHKETTEPIALVFTGDWHLGSQYMDYDKWKEDMLFLCGLPADRIKIVTTGDLIDNFFPKFRNAEPVFGTLSPGNQKAFIGEVIEILSPYMEVSCWGNHDNEWEEKNEGYSLIEKLLGKHSHYFYGKGYVDYIVGDEEYKISLSHEFQGTSTFHNLQGQMKEWQKTHSEIVVGAHKHTPGLLRDTFGCYPDGTPRKRFLIQVGTYKSGEDTYSMRYFGRGAIENTTLVLYPDKHKVVEFDCVEDAVKFMGITPKKVTSFKEAKELLVNGK